MTGARIIEDQTLVNLVEDWSLVRSPGRARRRRRLGHPQNIVMRAVPKPDIYSIDGGRTLIMHPEIAAALRRATQPQTRTQQVERLANLAGTDIDGGILPDTSAGIDRTPKPWWRT